jgi:hypothetical protein
MADTPLHYTPTEPRVPLCGTLAEGELLGTPDPGKVTCLACKALTPGIPFGIVEWDTTAPDPGPQPPPSAGLIYGGDPCPRCGIILDYDEREPGEPYLIHSDPQCGWFPCSYPERVTAGETP